MGPERVLELPNLCTQSHRVQGKEQLRQVFLHGRGHVGGGQDPLVGRLRSIIAPPDLAVNCLLLAQTQDWLEEVLPQPQLGVQGAHPEERDLRVVAAIADVLADHRPVALLDVGLVVLAIGPRAGEEDRDWAAVLAVLKEMVIDERAVVVRVQAPEQEGQPLLDGLDSSQGGSFASIGERFALVPTGRKIDHVRGVDELAIRRRATMHDQVNLQVPGRRQSRRG